MNPSDCPKEPFCCDHSVFYEEQYGYSQVIRRWVACERWYEDKESGLRVREYGVLCTKIQCDWWEAFIRKDECNIEGKTLSAR